MRKLLLLCWLLAATGIGLSAQCDLELNMVVSNPTPDIYEYVDYVVTLTNNGPQSATAITVKAPWSYLSANYGLVYTSHTTSAGEWNGLYQTWSLPVLANGASATLTLRLFTMKTALPAVFAEVSAASPADVDSSPSNGNYTSAVEDDEAAIGAAPISSCDLSLEFVDMECIPNDPFNTGDAYIRYKVQANTSDPAVQFVELSTDQLFLNSYYLVPGQPFAPSFSDGFYTPASSPRKFWARPLNNPGCVIRDTAFAPTGCGLPPAVTPCYLFLTIEKVFCVGGGFGFTCRVDAFDAPNTNGSYHIIINGTTYGPYSYGQTEVLGVFNPFPLPVPGEGVLVQAISDQDANCTSEWTVYPEQYCQPQSGTACFQEAVFPWHEWIQNVQLGDMSNSSGKSTWSDFRTGRYNNPNSLLLPPTVFAGETVPFSLETGYSFLVYTDFVRVWLDKNRDQIFQEPDEIIFEGQVPAAPAGAGASSILSANVLIPADALNGPTDMKVVLSRDGYASSCETVPFGEVEYYTVNVSGLPSGNICDEVTCTVLDVECMDAGTPDDAADDQFMVHYRVDLPGFEGYQIHTGGQYVDADGNYIFAAQNIQPFYRDGFVGVESLYGPVPISQFPLINLSGYIGDANNSYLCSYAKGGIAAPATCSNGGTVPAATPDCFASSYYPWEDWISGVKIGNFEVESGKSHYSDFSTTPVALQKGVTVPVRFTAGFSYLNYDEGWRLWIDYNHDGLFESPSEIAFEGMSLAIQDGVPFAYVQGNLTVPASALTGPARARLIMHRNAFPGSPCGIQPYGEVEDYLVEIAPGFQATPDRAFTPNQPSVKTPEFELFPNPAHEVVFLQYTSWAGEAPLRLTFCNQLGQIVREQTLEQPDAAHPMAIDLSGLPKGVYFVQLDGGDAGRSAKCFIVK